MRVDDFTGRKSPGNAAESATPKGKDPPAPLLLMQRGLGAACHSYSNVASGDATHQQNGAYSRADALLLLHRFLKAARPGCSAVQGQLWVSILLLAQL